MATAAERLDRNTGQPVKDSATNPSYQQTSAQVESGRLTTTTATQSDQTTQMQQQLQNMVNTTPQALSALNQLLATLSDKPAISEAQLDAEAPLPKRVYTSAGGSYFMDPKTGQNLTDQAAAALTAQRTQQRQAMMQAAGTIAGGTADQRATADARQQEIGRTREQQGKYSKEAAFADAQNLVTKAISDALRSQMPAIVQASEGAGTSKGSMRALLTQEAATRGAVEGAAQGSQLAGQYGQIFNQLEGVLEALTRQDPNSPAAMLLQAIIGSKGMVQSGSTTTTGSSTTNRTTNQVQDQGPMATVQATDRMALQPGVPMPDLVPAPATPTRVLNPVMVIQQDTLPGGESVFGNTAGIFESGSSIFDYAEEE